MQGRRWKYFQAEAALDAALLASRSRGRDRDGRLLAGTRSWPFRSAGLPPWYKAVHVKHRDSTRTSLTRPVATMITEIGNAKLHTGRPRAIHDFQDDGRNEEDAVMFVPVNVGRASNLVADQIRLLIHDGRLSPGDRLPCERQLSEQFGVSRAVVREALRGLEANGLVTVKLGARGGAFVTAPTIQQVGDGIADLLTVSVTGPEEVAEARHMFELSIVPLVCERADEQDLADLLEICDRAAAVLESGAECRTGLCADFHIRVARATHNSAIEMLARSLHGQFLTSLAGAQESGAATAGRVSIREHRNFVLAVQCGNCKAARAMMSEHLTCTRGLVAL